MTTWPRSMIVRGARVVFPDGERPASIHVRDGIIARVGAPGEGPSRADVDAEVVEAGRLVVSPGIVDTHVHINDPGRTEWEGFETGTAAAARGGVTTLIDMPLNSVPSTTTVDGLAAKRAAASGRLRVDVGVWGGVVPGNDDQLDALVAGGVRGFKCFLVPSGVDEFPAVDETDLRRALPAIARHGLPLLVHAELAEGTGLVLDPQVPQKERSSYRAYLNTRPPRAEVEAVRLMVRLAREFGARIHIVHVAACEAVAEIERAQQEGVAITAETCPHYLTFAAEDVPDGATLFKCAPPIRDATHRDALWDGLRRGVLTIVATDHSPAPPALKVAGDFFRAWGGIASLELSLAAVWTAARTRGFGVSDLARWMSEEPAALAGLSGRKGRLMVGADADLILWDPDAVFPVDAEPLLQRHKLTPYAGRTLRGVVHTTWLRGDRVWSEHGLAGTPTGGLL